MVYESDAETIRVGLDELKDSFCSVVVNLSVFVEASRTEIMVHHVCGMGHRMAWPLNQMAAAA